MIRHKTIHGNGPNISLILGWGDTLENPWVNWFIEQVKKNELNWNLLIIEFSPEITDFQEVIEDIKKQISIFKCQILLSHSMGGLFARYINNVEMRIFLAPYWSIPKHQLIFGSWHLSKAIINLLKSVENHIIPRGFKNSDIGDYLVSETPEFTSPSTVYQILEALKKMPKTREDDVVFYFDEDKVSEAVIHKDDRHMTKILPGLHNPFCTIGARDLVFQRLIETINGGKDEINIH